MVEVGAGVADHFVSGRRIDVTGTSIGKGFSGAMKPTLAVCGHHTVSISHRSHGSTGQCQIPVASSKVRRWPVSMVTSKSPR